MLAKKNRLTKREDFSRVYSKGLYVSINGIAIKYARSENVETRIGLSVGKKFSKKATQRNRIKRLLRQASRAHIQNIKAGFDIIIIPGAECEHFDFKKIVEIAKQLFIKANLFK